jgi:hypothetical protein
MAWDKITWGVILMRKVFGAVFLVLVLAGVACANAELDELRKHMRSNVDEVEGIKWIHDKATPKLIQGGVCHVYLGQKGVSMWPRFVLGFQKREWVFFEEIIFNIDGKRDELSFGYYEVKRDNSGYSVWEYVDIPGDRYLSLIKQISESKKTLIRFRGRQREFDFQVSKKQKDAMRRVLRLYELMR